MRGKKGRIDRWKYVMMEGRENRVTEERKYERKGEEKRRRKRSNNKEGERG